MRAEKKVHEGEIKITLTPQHTHTIKDERRKNRLHRPSQTQKCFELLTTNNMKLIEQIHNTREPRLRAGACMSLHKNQGKGGKAE